MSGTWILIAHRSGARLFEQTTGESMSLVWEIARPEGRLKNRDMSTDRPGQVVEAGAGGAKHDMSKMQSPKEHAAEVFAKDLAHKLDEGRKDNRFERLILIAEPSFLGLLKAQLSDPTAAKIVDTIDKDLANVPEREVRATLGEMLHH